MLSQLAQLFPLIYKGDNQQREYAESEINQLRYHEDFFSSLVSLISSDFDINIRYVSLLYLQAWIKSEDIPSAIFEVFPMLISSSPVEFYRTLKHISRILIEKVGFSNWPSLFDQIFIGFSSTENTIVSLILSLGLIPHLGDCFLNFSSQFFQHIFQLFSQKLSDEITSLLLNVLSRIFVYGPKEFLFSNSEIFSHVFPLCFDSTNRSEQVVYYASLFLKRFVSKAECSDFNFLSQILNFAVSVLQQSSVRTQSVSLELIYLVVRDFPFWEDQTLELFSVLFPFFAVDIFLDPPMFVKEVHKIDPNFENPQSIASKIIFHCCFSSPQAREIICQIIQKFLHQFSQKVVDSSDQSQFFSHFLFFSSTSNAFVQNELSTIIQLVNLLLPLLGSNLHFIRAAIFLFISSLSELNPPSNILQACFSGLLDNFILVQYYSAVALSNFLMNISDFSLIQELLTIPALDPFSLFLNLSSQFEHPQIYTGLSKIIKFYDVQVTDFSLQLAENLLASICSELDSESINISIDSLSYLIEHIPLNLVPSLLGKCIEVQLSDQQLFDSFMGCIIILLKKCPIKVDSVLTFLLKTIDRMCVSDFAEISIILLSQDMITNELNDFVFPMMKSVSDPVEWDALASVAAGMCYKGLINNEQFNYLCNSAFEKISTDNIFLKAGISLLINALLYSGNVSSILGDDFAEFYFYWMQNQVFPESVMTAVKTFFEFDDFDVQAEIFCAAFKSFPSSISIILGDSFVQFDDFEEVKSPWFDFGFVLSEFMKLVDSIQNTNIIETIFSDFNSTEQSIFSNLNLILEKYLEWQKTRSQ